MAAMMKVHGNLISTAAMRVYACLYEKDLEFELLLVDLRSGQNKKEPYLSLNPFGQIPAFEHGDLKLFESRAITKYIADEFADKGNQLSCPGKKVNELLWMEVEAHQFESPASRLTWELGIKPIFGIPVDEAVVEENEVKLAKVLDVYETQLAQSKYLACDSFTLVDLHHLPNIEYLVHTKVKTLFHSRPNVSAWVADIRARPAWTKVLAMRSQQ